MDASRRTKRQGNKPFWRRKKSKDMHVMIVSDNKTYDPFESPVQHAGDSLWANSLRRILLSDCAVKTE